MKWKILLRDFVVTVGLLAVTLLSFMSMRVVPMGTSWYLPYCASVGVGIIAVLCAVLFWDMVKGGKLGTDACGDCGEPSARYNIPFYLYIPPKGKGLSQVGELIELDLSLCGKCYYAFKCFQLRKVWTGLAICLMPRSVVLFLLFMNWGDFLIPIMPLMNLGIVIMAFCFVLAVWYSQTAAFLKGNSFVRLQLERWGGQLAGQGRGGAVRTDGKTAYDSTECILQMVATLFCLVLGLMTVFLNGFANPPCW